MLFKSFVSYHYIWSDYIGHLNLTLTDEERNIVNDIEASLREPWGWFEELNEKITVEIHTSDTLSSECFSEDIWL